MDDGQLTAKVNQQEEVAHITIVAFVSRKIMTHYYVQNMPIAGENPKQIFGCRISLFSRIANAEKRGFIRPSCTHEKPTITKPDNTRLGIEHHKLPKATTKLPKPAPP